MGIPGWVIASFVVAIVSPAVLAAWMWQRSRRTDLEVGVLNALLAGPMSALEICTAVGRKSGTMHPTLARLEVAGRIASSWWDDPDDIRRGRRMYLLVRP